MPRGLARHLLIALVLIAGFRALAEQALSGSAYGYDESDYMYAASRGWLANWTDDPSMNLTEFVRLGLGTGRDTGSRTQLSESIRDSGDIHFYRHWHGPLYYYGLALLQPWAKQERAVRAASLWIPAAGVMLVYFGCVWILPGAPAAALLAAALYGWGYTVVSTTELAPHQLFALLSLAGLFCLAKLEAGGDRRWWWAAVAAMAFSFATMEVAFIGVAVLLLTGWRLRSALRAGAGFSIRSVVLFAAVALAAWPAGLLKLEPVRSYLFMAYLALFRKGAWGDVTLADTWVARLSAAPAEWLLVAAAIAVWWRRGSHSEARKAARPFLLFGLLMLATMWKVYAVSPRYALLFLAPLAVFSGLALGAALERWPRAAIYVAAGAGLLVAVETRIYVQRHPAVADPQVAQMVATLRAHPLDGQTLLAPQIYVPQLHYYFPRVRLTAYRDETEKRKAIEAGGIDAVLSENEARIAAP